MRSYEPVEVGKRLRLLAPGDRCGRGGRVEVALARGAFGSGEHETTVACLEALEALDRLAGARALDLGCGTGVLAIAALALGARSAVAVDVDPRAVAVTRENCGHNGVADRAVLVCGTLADVPPGAGFDVVLANVPAAVLVAEAPLLVARAAAGAWLVLSGILWEELWETERSYLALGCAVARRRMLDEYALLVLAAP